MSMIECLWSWIENSFDDVIVFLRISKRRNKKKLLSLINDEKMYLILFSELFRKFFLSVFEIWKQSHEKN